MKKQKDQDPQVSIESINRWDDSGMMDIISQYGKYFVIALGALIVALLLIYQLWSSGQSRSTHDYLDAERDFRTFIGIDREKTPPEAINKAFVSLQELMKKHPELEAKYDGMIAQTLINRGQIDLAMPFAKRALVRTQKENSPYYYRYTETTLLINDKHYDKALQQAKELEKDLKNASKDTSGNVLIAFNILRIGILQHQLNQKSEEKETWKKLQQFLNENPEVTAQVNLQEGQISLLDYIKAQ